MQKCKFLEDRHRVLTKAGLAFHTLWWAFLTFSPKLELLRPLLLEVCFTYVWSEKIPFSAVEVGPCLVQVLPVNSQHPQKMEKMNPQIATHRCSRWGSKHCKFEATKRFLKSLFHFRTAKLPFKVPVVETGQCAAVKHDSASLTHVGSSQILSRTFSEYVRNMRANNPG